MQQSTTQIHAFSTASRLERLPVCRYHRSLFLIISLAFFFDNVDLALMSYLLGPIQREFGLSIAQTGLLGSASFVGMAVGAALSGLLADRFGRKPIFQCSMLVWGIASVMCAFAPDVAHLAVYRIVLGLGMGMELPIAQTMLSEFIPARQRGKYLALMDGNWPIAFICAGLLSYWLLSTASWRTVFLVAAAPSLFLFAVRRQVPESPRWLEVHGRHAEANTIVGQIETRVMQCLGLDRLPDAVPMLAPEPARRGTFGALWSPRNRRRTFTAWSLWFFALFGFYGLMTWLSSLMQHAGLDITKSVMYTVYISLGGIPGFLCAAWLVERWGRKPTCVMTLLGGAAMAYVYGQVMLATDHLLPMMATGFMMQFFLFGMWAVLYAYTPELYPTRLRATGCGFASTIGRVGSLLGPACVGWVLPLLGEAGIFALGAASFALAAAVVALIGIETRGAPLEAISE